MPTIITSSYFNGKLFVPNAIAVPDIQTSYGDDAPGNTNKLDLFIEKFERLLLVNALGNAQYQELILHMNDVTGKWHDLINGKGYDDKVFNGIKDIIAYFVYVHFLKYESVQFNTTGLERANAANSLSVDPTSRLVDYWNEFVQMYQHQDCFCWCFPFFPFGFNGDSTTSNFVSLYQYLLDHEESEVFDVSLFKFYMRANILGI